MLHQTKALEEEETEAEEEGIFENNTTIQQKTKQPN
jgi:hypothetical protein